jgi:hypothetical protein
MIELIYIGKGKGTLAGVPARDLTRAEIEASGKTIQELLASGLYVRSTLTQTETYKRTRKINQESE